MYKFRIISHKKKSHNKLTCEESLENLLDLFEIKINKNTFITFYDNCGNDELYIKKKIYDIHAIHINNFYEYISQIIISNNYILLSYRDNKYHPNMMLPKEPSINKTISFLLKH